LHPAWVHFVPGLDHYRKGEYREALELQQKMKTGGMANNYIVSSFGAAIYGQLGEIDKANEVIDWLVEKHPQFVEDPRQPYVARRMPPEFVESLMDGLRKAGYDVPAPKQSNNC
jgi:hypothetical protein